MKTRVKLSLPDRADGTYTLVLKPVEPAIVFEKIVVDYGGYEDIICLWTNLLAGEIN